MISRRKFLTSAFVATAGGILVVKELLSTKTYFLPPSSGWNDYPSEWFRQFAKETGVTYFELGNELWNGADVDKYKYKRIMKLQTSIFNDPPGLLAGTFGEQR